MCGIIAFILCAVMGYFNLSPQSLSMGRQHCEVPCLGTGNVSEEHWNVDLQLLRLKV